jgi:hypothetical protein
MGNYNIPVPTNLSEYDNRFTQCMLCKGIHRRGDDSNDSLRRVGIYDSAILPPGPDENGVVPPLTLPVPTPGSPEAVYLDAQLLRRDAEAAIVDLERHNTRVEIDGVQQRFMFDGNAYNGQFTVSTIRGQINKTQSLNRARAALARSNAAIADMRPRDLWRGQEFFAVYQQRERQLKIQEQEEAHAESDHEESGSRLNDTSVEVLSSTGVSAGASRRRLRAEEEPPVRNSRARLMIDTEVLVLDTLAPIAAAAAAEPSALTVEPSMESRVTDRRLADRTAPSHRILASSEGVFVESENADAYNSDPYICSICNQTIGLSERISYLNCNDGSTDGPRHIAHARCRDRQEQATGSKDCMLCKRRVTSSSATTSTLVVSTGTQEAQRVSEPVEEIVLKVLSSFDEDVACVRHILQCELMKKPKIIVEPSDTVSECIHPLIHAEIQELMELLAKWLSSNAAAVSAVRTGELKKKTIEDWIMLNIENLTEMGKVFNLDMSHVIGLALAVLRNERIDEFYVYYGMKNSSSHGAAGGGPGAAGGC